jgi:hypothetical protein
MNHEQTEIDALAALRPNDLRRIALDAIKPFYDSTLRSRSARAASIWDTEVRRRLEASPGWTRLTEECKRFYARYLQPAGRPKK